MLHLAATLLGRFILRPDRSTEAVPTVFSRQMNLTTAIKFCHRLGTGLKAGADLLKLLDSEANHGSSSHRQAMLELARGANDGQSLSAIMAREKYFPRLMAAMVRVGEETGKLEHTLLTLSEHYRHQLATRRWFISSITWPALQLVAGIGVISLLIYLLGVLTPAGGGQMTDVLGFGLRGGSGVLWFWFYIAMFFGIVAAMVWAFMRNIAGVQNLIPLFYKIPVIGPAIQTITISKFCWTLSLSLGSGLDPIRSVALSLDSTDSDYYRSAASDAEDAVRSGSTLAGALQATSLFPDDFIQRIEIAEHSGTDAESIDFLTKEYDERAKRAIKVIAGIATVLIRIAVMGVLIFLIFRLASSYLGALNSAGAPINPRGPFGN
jgi:type II secretory pathway component PulF